MDSTEDSIKQIAEQRNEERVKSVKADFHTSRSMNIQGFKQKSIKVIL
ncbi:MAG: hypothetical protein WCF21_00650 [Nitrososphaeraceae archaeon]